MKKPDQETFRLLLAIVGICAFFAGFTWEYYRNKTFKVRSQAIKENIAAGSKLSKGKLP